MIQHPFDTAPSCYFSFDDNGIILIVNQTLCNVLGYGKEDLVSQNIETIFPISTRIFYQTHFFPLLKLQGKAAEIFIFLKARNNEQVPVLLSAERQEFEGVIHNSCAGIVVMNRKKYEDELVSAKKQAETALSENTALQKAKSELSAQTEKLDQQLQLISRQNNELKQFSRVATHNLQEPIRKMLLFGKMVDAHPQADNDLRLKLQKFMRASATMRETINGLQQYIWLRETTPGGSKVDLAILVTTVQNELSSEFSENLLDATATGLPVIMGDSEQVKLLFYHLLKNAIQYRKPGEKASITVSASLIKKNLYRSVEHKYDFQEFLQLTVKDRGIGFEPHHKDIIFDLFKKLHHLDRRGIGLSLARQVVENHGGWIEADSNITHGTTFSVFFPAAIVAEAWP